ncbi:MAG TPA: proline--tRNA ligase, partial [bacterium]|nr:proline--tRNA ligase [bacterium]
IWESIQQVLDQKFKKTGVENAYFPLLIPESYLKREADHVEGFAPELAVVTHAGGEKLAEPLVIRPTSETIIYEMFSKWISSYRDLPVVINQWANVVRWEKRTRLFLRTTEFLWQEGHTAHATSEDAYKRAEQMHEVYRSFAEDYLAMPVIMGKKTESEKFAGAETTYTIEAMMQDGKALQAGTSHVLAEHFTKAFNVKFLDADGREKYVRSTSWGASTRLIGSLIMAHSDDSGLVLPPMIAPIQVVIVPVWSNEEEKEKILAKSSEIEKRLNDNNVKVKIDDREMRPGPRFFEWEKKGVPLRLEIGPRDLERGEIILVRRDTGEKGSVGDDSVSEIKDLLITIQNDLFEKAKEFREDHTKSVSTFNDLQAQIEDGFALAGWCGSTECEEKIKSVKGTIRCIPLESSNTAEKCSICGKKSKYDVVVAKAY